MSREEAKKELSKLIFELGFEDNVDDKVYALNMAIQALSQEPCEDEYIKVPKKALKYRTAGMVAYNAEWLKNNFDIERAVICGVQEPTVTSTDEPMTMVYPTIVCDDAISREAAIKHLTKARMLGDSRPMTDIFAELPSVTQKSGKWIETEYHRWRCSVCREKGMSEWDNIHDARTNFCPDCGAKMVEPQESEEQTV